MFVYIQLSLWLPTLGEVMDLIILALGQMQEKSDVIFVLVVKITNVEQMCFHICP